MKYVRTKEKVYEVVEENERYYKCCYDDGSITLVAKFDNDVNGFSKALKTADNLTDLCDGFYNDILGDGCFNFDGLYIYNDFESFKDDWLGYRTHDNWEGDGYGFIKTPKGLIYVVKMNDKGELELI